MTTLEWILISVGGLLALIVVVGFFLPRKVQVQRATIIDAEPQAIFPHINNLKQFVEWSPWTEKDPNAKFEFSGPESGPGAKYSWDGEPKKVGKGVMEITNSTEDKRVDTAIDFGRMGLANASWVLEGKDNKVKLTWTFHTDMGMNPLVRYFGLMMDKYVGTDFEHGLNKLKAKIENTASTPSV